MKTHYRILWVDDDIAAVEDDIADIKEFFEGYGIEANIMEFLGGADTDIHEAIKNELQNPDTDLIVVDFAMDGMDGSELIQAIRATDRVFLPVVFYSIQGPEKLHKQVAELSLDGVYISGRDNVRGKIEEVAKSLLRKEQTSKHTRGLLMESVSELDAHLYPIFCLLWKQLDEEMQKELVKCFNRMTNKKSMGVKKLKGSLSADDLLKFRARMESDFLSIKYDMFTRWNTLKKMFELLGIETKEVNTFRKLYKGKKSLIKMRNDYAHKTRSKLDKDHDDGVCKAIRQEIRLQMRNTLEDIPNLLKKN